MQDNPILRRLSEEIEYVKSELKRVLNVSVRAEIAGAVARLLFANLPTDRIAGRLYFVTDVAGGLLYVDNGTDIQPVNLLIAQDFGAGIAGTTIITNATDLPTVNPGWLTSNVAPMNPPNTYLKIYIGTQAYVIPVWTT